MRIYKVHTEHKRWGKDFNSYKVAARNLSEAVRKAKKQFCSKQERPQSIELLASED